MPEKLYASVCMSLWVWIEKKCCEKLWLINLKAVSSPKGDWRIHSVSFALTYIFHKNRGFSWLWFSIFSNGQKYTENERVQTNRTVSFCAILSASSVHFTSIFETAEWMQLIHWLNKQIHRLISIHVPFNPILFPIKSKQEKIRTRIHRLVMDWFAIFPYLHLYHLR